MKFDRLNLHEKLLKGIKDAGFEKCTPVQEQSLPESLAGKDIIVQSQTGTGKTAVYLLSILNKLESEAIEAGKPRALIMVPTRELATQVDEDAKLLGKHLPFRSLAVYGGVGYAKQESELKRGVDIIAATPGRMIDLYKSKTLSLDSIDHFIIDEADRMFDMGFTPDIRYIANHLPANRPRQTMLFSATIDSRVVRLASKYMKPDPVLVEIEPEQVTVDLIDQKIVYVSNEEKLSTLMALLKRPGFDRVIIFTNMKRTAEQLGFKLEGNQFQAKVITGDVAQAKRENIIDRMKSGKIKILVATDVAARGLHIEGVTHVINYDLPNDAPNYVHRIGRTARAGKTGISYSLVCEDHVLNLPNIENFIDSKIEKEWVDEEDLVEDKAGPYSFKRGRDIRQKNVKGRDRGKPVAKRGPPAGDGKRSKKPYKRKESEPGKRTPAKDKRKSIPSSQEERLAYYKKKYGEDFSSKKKSSKQSERKKTGTVQKVSKTLKQQKPAISKSEKKPEKKGNVLKKIFKVFGK